MLPGSPRAQTGPVSFLQDAADAALLGPELELGQHRAAQLAELDRLGAQLDLRVEPRQVEEVGGQPPEAPGLRTGTLQQCDAPPRGRGAAAQVLVEQLEHPVQ